MILRPYQEVGRDFLADHRHALLADEMRVGKTPQAILACAKVKAEVILVVCPAIAVEHWKREFHKWWAGAAWPAVTVLSYDRARLQRDDLLAGHYDAVIVDECHYAKNPNAQRTKLIYGKGGLGYCTERMWVLSGTPAPKHAAELWPMLRAFGVTALSYDQFVRAFCTVNQWTGKIIGTKVARIPELRAALATIMLRRTRKDVAPDMPAVDFQFLEVDPVSHADLKYATRFTTDAALEAYIDSAAVGTWDVGDRVEVAKAKALPLVENICFAIENDLLKQTVVFGWHIEPLEAVTYALQARGIAADMITGSTSQSKRVEIQNAFRHGKLQVIVGNILAAGTAIDLSAASHGYFLELDWVPGNNLQAANRLVSMDKQEPVTFDVATWPGSIDDRVQRILLKRATELSTLYKQETK